MAKPKVCVGKYYRYDFQSFTSGDGDINIRHRMRYLKSKSCSDERCAICAYLEEYVAEACADLMENIRLEYIESYARHRGKVFQLQVLGHSIDRESGFVDDVDVGFREVLPTDWFYTSQENT